MSLSRRRFLQGSGAVVGLTAAAGALGTPVLAATARTWLLTRSGFDSLNDPSLGGNAAVCRSAFGTGTTWFATDYVPGSPVASPVPAGYTGIGVLKFGSYQGNRAGLLTALKAGLPSWVQAVQYDSEGWFPTPNIEQGAWLYNAHPKVSYAQQFCQTAHAHGLRVILSPGNDLCNDAPNPAYPGKKPQYPLIAADQRNNYNAYVRYQFASAAKYLQAGDVFEYQAQPLEMDVTTYRQITTTVAAQVRAANPNVTVLAGLGRSKSSSDGATCAQLTSAANSVSGVVSGYWANVGAYSAQVKPMICALRKLGY